MGAQELAPTGYAIISWTTGWAVLDFDKVFSISAEYLRPDGGKAYAIVSRISLEVVSREWIFSPREVKLERRIILFDVCDAAIYICRLREFIVPTKWRYLSLQKNQSVTRGQSRRSSRNETGRFECSYNPDQPENNFRESSPSVKSTNHGNAANATTVIPRDKYAVCTGMG
ncbi:uncharacterized protein CIMG_05256 [Coccidioides immitis RS]|uniref:Uncharacterized protein n=3 Tax=Coccidioides TaxID=5500 RepID=A0A0E1RYR5_COCIM|nr:uncharacterized protein CIMG_05256 [Coccidioides immitis RS]EAS34232.1 hypothetical protein CIMG_05256 [Coccidioides immitis RS]EFW17620.1 conserved hypothetical protein [Coccidioides posadasii str. Silveira]KMM70738.1 hypothetical protein CPAG_07049 [Coccidioides posadasii RMSCC 3488]